MLPAIDIPADLLELNQRLPAPRYSSDNVKEAGALAMAARFGAAAIRAPPPAPDAAAAADAPAAAAAAAAAAALAAAAATAAATSDVQAAQQAQQVAQQRVHMHRTASPLTVLESDQLSWAASGSEATPSAASAAGTGGSDGLIDACLEAALAAEKLAGGTALKPAVLLTKATASPFLRQQQQRRQQQEQQVLVDGAEI